MAQRAAMRDFVADTAAFAFFGHRASTCGSTFSISCRVWAMHRIAVGPDRTQDELLDADGDVLGDAVEDDLLASPMAK